MKTQDFILYIHFTYKVKCCERVRRMDYEAFVAARVAQLRQAKGGSARDMSLSLGQNENYINQIENRKTVPSLQALFYICDFFHITPMEFFDKDNATPETLKALIENLKKLDFKALTHLSGIVEEMIPKE